MNTTTQNTTQYKNSPLGLIPEDWEVKKLGELGEFKNGINKDKEDFGFGFPMVNLMDVFGVNKVFKNNLNLTLVNANERDLRDFSLKKGDVLFIRSSVKPTGVGLTTLICDDLENTTFSGFIIRFRDNDYFNSEFKAHCFYEEGFRQRLLNKSTISANTNINQVALKSLSIPIPPLPEQVAIANCLSTWDAAIEKHTALIAQKELSKKALMQQLLSGKKRLKGFSDKWNLKSLEEVATFRNGKAHENGIDEDGAYKVVNSKFVSTNGTVFKSSNDNLCPLFANEIAMVMSDIPNGKALAKCFYVDENNKYTLNQRICSITANKDTNSKFLFFILNRNVHYLSFDNGVGQTNLKKEEVLECPLLIPDFHEQTAIANVLQCADAEIQLLKSKLAHLKEQKKGLMQVLLTGKKRLKI